MTLPRLLHNPRFVRLGIAVDTAPAWLWLVLLAGALWPTWVWMARRLLDGSDDPLGLLALGALGLLVWQQRRALRPAPRLGWLAFALAGAVAALGAQAQLPALATSLLALLALAAGLAAFLPGRVPAAPVAGLAVLSLPLLASLQFYLGYPLRVLTAEASRWLLQWGYVVERSGATLTVDGQLILVDAPCSGVQMAWFGYFSACVAALVLQRDNRAFASRLPAVSALVLLGNVLRNSVLVAAEATGDGLRGAAHEAVGLVALAAVCGAIVWVMARPVAQRPAPDHATAYR